MRAAAGKCLEPKASSVTQSANLSPGQTSRPAVQVLTYWMARGYRILGLAEGRILADSKQDLTKITLQNIKQHTYGMRLLGFAVISNPLRSDSTAAITELQDRYIWMYECLHACMHACMDVVLRCNTDAAGLH